jgi:hypothetical protein
LLATIEAGDIVAGGLAAGLRQGQTDRDSGRSKQAGCAGWHSNGHFRAIKR